VGETGNPEWDTDGRDAGGEPGIGKGGQNKRACPLFAPFRLNVWMISGEGVQPACPKRDFLTWYEDWLDGKDSFYAFPH
jgi:hypothetical protein